jgi:hypothetical protein
MWTPNTRCRLREAFHGGRRKNPNHRTRARTYCIRYRLSVGPELVSRRQEADPMLRVGTCAERNHVERLGDIGLHSPCPVEAWLWTLSSTHAETRPIPRLRCTPAEGATNCPLRKMRACPRTEGRWKRSAGVPAGCLLMASSRVPSPSNFGTRPFGCITDKPQTSHLAVRWMSESVTSLTSRLWWSSRYRELRAPGTARCCGLAYNVPKRALR